MSLPKNAPKGGQLEAQHKALLFVASVIVKTFLMTTVATHVFCGDIDPRALFQCVEGAGYVGGSAAAVAVMGAVFGYYVVRLETFEKIFPQVMKTDFILTAMYFGVAFTAPELVAQKAMIWLFGIWVLGMLLSPFNSERTALKKVTEYGSLAALGALFTLHFIPQFSGYGSSYTAGMMVSSVLAAFGAGRQ